MFISLDTIESWKPFLELGLSLLSVWEPTSLNHLINILGLWHSGDSISDLGGERGKHNESWKSSSFIIGSWCDRNGASINKGQS